MSNFAKSPSAVEIKGGDISMRRARIALERGQRMMAEEHYHYAQLCYRAAIGPDMVCTPFHKWVNKQN